MTDKDLVCWNCKYEYEAGDEFLTDKDGTYCNKCKCNMDKPLGEEPKPKIKKVVLAVSCVHTMPSSFVQALFRFVDINKDRFVIKVLVEEFYIIDEARNTLILKALIMDEKPDYVLFVDADNMLQYNTLDLLINEDKDIISGVYFKRVKPFYPLAFKKLENGEVGAFTEWVSGDIAEVDYVGAGCLLVKREVLEKMKYPYFYVARNIEEKVTIGEDIMFCAEVKRLGYKIWLHTGVNVGHIGGRCVNINDWFMYKNQGNYEVNARADLKDVGKYCLHKVV